MSCLKGVLCLLLLLSAYSAHSLSLGKNNLSSSRKSFLGNRASLPVIVSSSSSSWQQQQKIVSRAASRRSSSLLSMHMGHSHSHHHHHDNHHDDDEHKHQHQDPAKIGMKRRRRVALFLFAALAILGPPAIRNRSFPGRTDLVAFGFTCTALATFDAVRREIKYSLSKMKSFSDLVLKHSPAIGGVFRSFFHPNEEGAVVAAADDDSNSDSFSPISSLSGGSNGAVSTAAADRVTIIGVIVNLLLSIGKFVIGVTCHSSALIADAGHSLSDLFSDFVTLYTVQVARLPPDDDHPYGHGKFEAIGSLFLALTLLGTGIGVGTVANKELIQILTTKNSAAATAAIQLPTPPALIMAAISIFSKEWLYRITKRVGDALNSQVVIANAWHHRSDAYSSILALISIGLAMFIPGLKAADSAAGLLVAGMICMTGADILMESINQLSDTNNDDIVKKATKIVNSYDDVIDIRQIRARQVGSSAFVDVSIVTSDILSSSAARTVEQRIGRQILDELHPAVIDVEVRHAYDSGSSNGSNTGRAASILAAADSLAGSAEVDATSSMNSDENNNNMYKSTTDSSNEESIPLDDNDYYGHRRDHERTYYYNSYDDDILPSAAEVETTVREVVSSYGDIVSTESVTVNYYDEEHRDGSKINSSEPQEEQLAQEEKEQEDEQHEHEQITSTVITVDVNIGIQPKSNHVSINYVHELATKIKESLEHNKDVRIGGANIFLDLNQQLKTETPEEDDSNSEPEEDTTKTTASSSSSTPTLPSSTTESLLSSSSSSVTTAGAATTETGAISSFNTTTTTATLQK